MSEFLLGLTLDVAVPLWIEEWRERPWEERVARAGVCSQHVAEHGDVILFKGGKKGESGEAFNHLAEGLALLAFVPGGVRFLGRHWEAGDATTGPESRGERGAGDAGGEAATARA